MIGNVKQSAQHSANFTEAVDQSSGRLSVILSIVFSPNAEYPTAPKIRNITVMHEKPVVRVPRNCMGNNNVKIR
jgi:hypothetical protein